jgi:hypothetical protein
MSIPVINESGTPLKVYTICFTSQSVPISNSISGSFAFIR